MSRHDNPEKGRNRKGKKDRKDGPPTAQDREVLISKKLSWVLRHGAKQEKLKMDQKGFVNVQELLSWQTFRSLQLSFSELQQIVTSNDKQRFLLEPSPPDCTPLDPSDPSHFLIRASQGHSLAIDSAELLTPLDPDATDCPNEVVHGTYASLWPQILSSGGLKRMGRTHVHFARGVPEGRAAAGAVPALKVVEEVEARGKGKGVGKTDGEAVEEQIKEEVVSSKGKEGQEQESEKVVSGMRKGANLMVWVDVKRSAKDGGLKWWKSANGVVLTEGDGEGMVKVEWLSRAVGRKDGEVVWQREKEVETTAS